MSEGLEFIERRGAERAETMRKALVSQVAGQGGLLSGTAVEVSADGLRLLTPVPLPVGGEVEVQVSPKEDRPGEAPLTVVGRVVWVQAQAEGGYAMGVRLYEDAPVGEAVQVSLKRGEAPWPAEESANTARRVDAKSRRRWRWVATGIVGLLLLLLFARTIPRWGFSVRLGRASVSFETVAARAEERDALDAAQVALAAGNAVAAGEAFAPLVAGGQTPAARLIAALGQAEALRMQGRVPEALVAVGKAVANMEDAPKAWQALARDYRAALLKDGGAAAAPPLLVDALELVRPASLEEPPTAKDGAAPQDAAEAAPTAQADRADTAAPGTDANARPAREPLRLEVDQSDYVLRALRGNQVVAEYPVGLGSAGSTPLGDFVIANKLLDPDWFNRGERVKAGDPRNPLGRHWMGLGNQQGRTSYGIHETKEGGSIGANRSRGCVRMRPEDATALFALCDVGTPVRIVE